MRNSSLIISLCIAGALTACGGNSDKKPVKTSSSSSVVSSAVQSSVAPGSVAPSSVANSAATSSRAQALTGVFLDAPVSNLGYSTATLNGTTNAAGEFQYRAGEMITFSIGNLILPAVPAGSIITPFDLAGSTSLSDNKVINILRLLQSLDADGNAANGIEIPAAAIAAGTQLDFSLAPAAFADAINVKALLQAVGGVSKELVSTEQAVTHFQSTLETINGPAPSSSSQSSHIVVTPPSSAAESSSSSSSSVRVETGWACPATGLYFCDDFSANNYDKWNAKPSTVPTTPNGTLDIADDSSNYVLRYTADSTGGVIALVKPAEFAAVTSADYYVEAKIRPRANATTGNKELYLLARYQDANNWYAGAFNVQNANTSTNVEIAKMKNGTLTRPKQVKKPIDQGTIGMLDGKWYTLRFEVLGSTLTVYLDGETVGTITDADFTSAGVIGLWTRNKSFEVDDVKVGNANDKPASLLISPSATNYAAEVGDAARVINVTAKTETGATDLFTVVSSDNSVVSVGINGSSIILTPVGVGSATITFTSASKPDLVRKITASIAPQFVMPTATYDLGGRTVPEVAEASAYEDATLKLSFDSAPTLGSAGSIRIFKTSDDSLVDKIGLVDEKDDIGYGTLRSIKTRPVRISGNTASISLHANKLQYGTSYYVAISGSVFTGATLAGKPFEGIGKASGWTFTTRAAGPDTSKTALTVDDDGSAADFRSVQGALNFVMKNVALDTPATITVRSGTYEEPLVLRSKNNLTIQGESRTGTVIQYPNNELLNSGSEGRALMLVSAADMLTLESLTLKNTTLIGAGGQAETLYFNSPTGRLIAKDASFISEQDTLLLKGWNWFYNTLVAGNVDFIWGYSKAALFEKSEIRSLGRSSGNNNGGYVLQARVEAAGDKGFVFLNSMLTSGAGPTGELPLNGSHYLARSPGPTSPTFDNIVFVNTKMGSHIATGGWAGLGVNNQPVANPATGTATSGWREFNTMDIAGNTVSLAGRQFSYELSLAQIAGYCSRAQVFSAYNSGAGWNPLPEDISDCVDVDGVGGAGSSAGASSTGSNSSSSAAASNGAGSSSSSDVVVGSSASSAGNSSSSSSVDFASCSAFNNVQGFAARNGGVTGGADLGAGNNVVTVTTGAELNAAVSATNPTYNTKPLVVYVGGHITWENSNSAELRIRRSNVSIIGLPDSGEISGVGFHVSHGASNIIFRNLKMHEVPQTHGSSDHIHLDGQDGAVSNIWIDHNEFYNDLTVDKDFYDELVSGRSAVHNVTISYNYLHDSQKTSLWGSSDTVAEEDVGRTISFHHNYWKNVVSRLPLFRFGEGHIWNNYYQNVTGSGINSRMGAKLRIDNNVFEGVKNPILSVDSANIGYWNATGNSFSGVTWGDTPVANCTAAPCYAGTSDSATTDYQPPYSYNAMPTVDVKTHVTTYAGRNKITSCLGLAEASSSSSSSSSDSSSSSSAAPMTTTWVPTYEDLQTAVAAAPVSGSNSSFNATPAPVTIGGVKFYSSTAGSLRLHLATDGTYAVNYNGTSVKSDTTAAPVTFVEGASQVNPALLNVA
ncbi:MAG TPA: pectinesterase family protein, partial [Cellvibrio sp.]|nr:pectinesterase family protein [Cellvibrio sp.]